MSEPAVLLSAGDIAASNVLPALETSRAFGATEGEIAEIGWEALTVKTPDAAVSGASTYQHMELMYRKPRYPSFVVGAATAHGASSLGIVGLSCKTVPTVAAALACHSRFQQLTNRTARYSSVVEHGRLVVREERFGPPSLGSSLMSDYTMLVAVHLLTLLAGKAPRVLAMLSRRESMPNDERELYEAFVNAPLTLDERYAELWIDPAILVAPVPQADPELSAYFTDVLSRAPTSLSPPDVLDDVRRAIRDRIMFGTPAVEEVAKSLGVGARTLQRRLAERGIRFSDLVEETRRILAEAYLRRSELALAEVAYLLGYVEQASFFRAFRRWYGTTPDVYRRSR